MAKILRIEVEDRLLPDRTQTYESDLSEDWSKINYLRGKRVRVFVNSYGSIQSAEEIDGT